MKKRLFGLFLLTGSVFALDCSVVTTNSLKEYECQKNKIDKKYGQGPKFFNKEDPTSLLSGCLKSIAPMSNGENVIFEKENNGIVTYGTNQGKLVFFANIDGNVYELDRSPFVATKDNRNYATYLIKTPKGEVRYHLFESSSGFSLITDSKFKSPEYQEKFKTWEKKSLTTKINNYLADGAPKKEIVVTNSIQNPNVNKYFISSVVNELNESIKHVHEYYLDEKYKINDAENDKVRILDYMENLKKCKASVESLGGREIATLIDSELKKFSEFEKPSLPIKSSKKAKSENKTGPGQNDDTNSN